jgi:ornithine carbamoyltransferase
MKKIKKIDFLTLKDFDKDNLIELIDLTKVVKKNPKKYTKVLKDKNIALLFDKHSTRTRLSFEAGISQMGGNAIYLDSKSLQLSRGENYSDTAKIFSGYLDGVVIRTFEHKIVEIFAENSSIPVINGLTDSYHPCQILSDLFTIKELGLLKPDLRFTYLGDSNNVTNSLMIGLSKLGMGITIGFPAEYSPSPLMIEYCNEIDGSNVILENDPERAVRDADIIYTDVWVSMGDSGSKDKIKRLTPYQVNKNIVEYASSNVKIMHCLPAHRGEEITSDIIDGKNSVIFQQAENRLYAQKALLAYIYNRL